MEKRYIIDYYADMASDIAIIDTQNNKKYSFKAQGMLLESICNLLNEYDKEIQNLKYEIMVLKQGRQSMNIYYPHYLSIGIEEPIERVKDKTSRLEKTLENKKWKTMN